MTFVEPTDIKASPALSRCQFLARCEATRRSLRSVAWI